MRRGWAPTPKPQPERLHTVGCLWLLIQYIGYSALSDSKMKHYISETIKCNQYIFEHWTSRSFLCTQLSFRKCNVLSYCHLRPDTLNMQLPSIFTACCGDKRPTLPISAVNYNSSHTSFTRCFSFLPKLYFHDSVSFAQRVPHLSLYPPSCHGTSVHKYGVGRSCLNTELHNALLV